MRCQEIEELLSAYADGELKSSEQQIVSSHLKNCNYCLVRLNQINAIKDALKMPVGFDVPHRLAQKLDRLAAQCGTMPNEGSVSYERKLHGRAVGALRIFSMLHRASWQKYATAVAVLVVMLVAATITTEFPFNRGTNVNIQDKDYAQKPTAKAKNPFTAGPHPLIKGPDRKIANHDIDDGLDRILKDEIDINPEDLGYNAIKTYKRIGDARAALSYDIPVPTNTNGRKLKGLYVESGDVLYIKYEGGIFLIYHESVVDPSKAVASTGYQVNIRGHDALAVENESRDQLRSLGWHENWHGYDLNIAVYGTQNVEMTELISVARSMK